jgi:2-methylcitrate dehydratase PrpD
MIEKVEQILDHILHTRFEHLTPAAIEASKTFVLDTLGVGLSGSRVDFVPALIQLAQNQWGSADQAHVWCTGEPLPASSAAMINAYQIHNQEFDCVHEAAVVHPMAVILSSLAAYAQRLCSQGTIISGREFLLALNIAVDVATIIGMSATQPMKFFRPGMCGGLGAVAGLCRLAGLSRNQSRDALGIMYSQLGGTMQAHFEGSATLPMQIAFNARNAVMAVDLAEAGLNGPGDILDGPFGFFTLMEDKGNANAAFKKLGRQWQITQISHKPFPTGRAAHGGLDGIASLQAQHGLTPGQIKSIRISAPPLILRLVNRPATAEMNHNYAKLCMGYIAATWLLTGAVTVEDYEEDCLRDPQRLALAKTITMNANSIEDPNALAPQAVSISLNDGRELHIDLPQVLGHPQRPLSREQHLDKFRRCCTSAKVAFDEVAAEGIIDVVEQLPALADIRQLLQRLTTDPENK